MRIALIADIHANLPAVEAVLGDISQQGVDAIYHLGDLVGYAPWPNEVIELLTKRGIMGVAGNYDSTVASDYKHCGCRYEDAQQERLSHISYDWTRTFTSAASKRVLGSLPFRLDLRPGHLPGSRVVLVHGTPTLNTVYWTEDRTDTFTREMIAAAGGRPGDVIAFGHTHVPWTRVVDGVRLVNAGSVGRPKDGDWRACYALIHFAKDEAATVKFVRVEYDVERAAAGIIESGLPAEFSDYLRTGGQPSAVR